MHTVDQLFLWTNRVLCWGQFALWIAAAVDCATRKAGAFPAADKLTKPAWLAILVLAGLFGYLVMQPFSSWGGDPTHFVSLLATCAAGVYLADVRPAIQEITKHR